MNGAVKGAVHFVLCTMSQILSFFCLQRNMKVFGECIITEKKRSGFEVLYMAKPCA